MRILRRSFVLAVIAACATVAVASAATPKPGGTYKGMSASHHSVRITVARRSSNKDVYKAVLSYCGYKVGIFIVRGHFGAHVTTAGGAVSVFRMNGFFKTRQLVQGRIGLDFSSGCDSRPGPWSATLT